MGYGNIRNIVFEDGRIVDCNVHDEHRASKARARVSKSREQRTEDAQKKQAEEEMREFVNRSKKSDFIGFE